MTEAETARDRAKIPSIAPHLVCAGAAAAIDFYKQAFGAVELMRLAAPDGTIVHADLKIGDSTLMLGEEAPGWGRLGPNALHGTPVTISLFVDDADAAAARAVAAGATVIIPVAEQFWGDRYGVLQDPFGHRWSVAAHVRDVGMAEMEAALRDMPAAPSEPKG